MRLKHAASVLASIALYLAALHEADAQTRFAVTTPKRPTFELSAVGVKLSPELRPTVNANVPLVGLTRDGNPVLEFNRDTALQQAKERIESLSRPSKMLDSTSEITPVSRLIVLVNPASMNAASIANLPVVDRSTGGRFLVLQAPASVQPALLQQLVDDPAVRYVEPSFLYSLERTPNDPLYTETGLWGMRAIHAATAWDLGTGLNMVVAVIDTGVDYDHPDIAANIWRDDANHPGHDYLLDNDEPKDQHGHGTHVAGTIGAVGDNGVGLVGVNWSIKLMPLRVFGKNGEFAGTEKVVQAIDYAVAHGAKVINNSWGGPNFSQVIKEAINRAERTTLFVAAAGNQFGSDNDDIPRYPASYGNENIISVMSVDPDDTLSSFSNFGRTSVHIAAPGAGIESLQPNNGYAVQSGTSMATPHVSGAAALLWSLPKYASKTPAEIKKLVLDNARPVAGLRDKNVTGGMLDLSFVSDAQIMTPTAAPVTVSGELQVPHAAIGGETTGTVIVTKSGVVELAIPPGTQQTLQQLTGERVTVTGVPVQQKSLERSDRRILQLQ